MYVNFGFSNIQKCFNDANCGVLTKKKKLSEKHNDGKYKCILLTFVHARAH